MITAKWLRSHMKEELSKVMGGKSVHFMYKGEELEIKRCTPKEKSTPKSPSECTQAEIYAKVKAKEIHEMLGPPKYGCGCKKDDKVLCKKHGRY
ncbi:MAG: hypothetical protein GY861_26860 [bacterium]|nr:hypothetical protein [bacterium]